MPLKHHSDDTKRRISLALTGRPKSAEWRRKIGDAHIGMKRSPAARANISAAVRHAYESGRLQARNQHTVGRPLPARTCAPRVLGGGVAQVALGRNKFALIDEADVELVSSRGWRARQMGGLWYALSLGKDSELLHRFLLNPPADRYVDHANGNGLDNRRANLRLATNSQNQANRLRQSNNSSGFRGVTLHRQTQAWRAQIKVKGVNHHLGLFRTAEEAARAYDTAAIEYFGEFARLNFGEMAA